MQGLSALNGLILLLAWLHFTLGRLHKLPDTSIKFGTLNRVKASASFLAAGELTLFADAA